MSEYYKTTEISELSDVYILCYEMMMLNKISIIPTNDNNIVENNIRLESFLLHARNIIEFLSDDKHGAYLKCSQFKDSNGKKIGSVEVVPKEVVTKINEYLSHISNNRKKKKIEWYLDQLKQKINQEFNHFLNKVSSEYFPSKEGLKKSDFEQYTTIN